MRYMILFLIVSCSICSFGQSVTEKDFDKLSWLEGSWIRTNVKPGRTAFESWTKGNGKELTIYIRDLLGVGRCP